MTATVTWEESSDYRRSTEPPQNGTRDVKGEEKEGLWPGLRLYLFLEA